MCRSKAGTAEVVLVGTAKRKVTRSGGDGGKAAQQLLTAHQPIAGLRRHRRKRCGVELFIWSPSKALLSDSIDKVFQFETWIGILAKHPISKRSLWYGGGVDETER